MSTQPGNVSKGEKAGKSGKYQSLKINALLYNTKPIHESDSQPTKTIAQRTKQQHGMQPLGKVPLARKPANLPSLKSECSGNDAPVNIVPTGGTGWGTNTKEGGNASSVGGNQTQAVAGVEAFKQRSSGPGHHTESGTKTWANSVEALTPTFLTHRSPLFNHEFPSLSAGNEEATNGTGGKGDFTQGPSLRPQLEGNWAQGGRGPGSTNQCAGNQYVTALAQDRQKHPYNAGSDGARNNLAPSGAVAVQAGPQQQIFEPIPPQFNGILPAFMMKNAYPNGFTPNTTVPSKGGNQCFGNSRAPANDDGKAPPPARPKEEEYKLVPIISEAQLRHMAEMETSFGWAANIETDYDQKLNFSDDEDDKVEMAPPITKKLSFEKEASSSPKGSMSSGILLEEEEEDLREQQRQKSQEMKIILQKARERRDEELKRFDESKEGAKFKEDRQTLSIVEKKDSVTIPYPDWEKDKKKDEGEKGLEAVKDDKDQKKIACNVYRKEGQQQQQRYQAGRQNSSPQIANAKGKDSKENAPAKGKAWQEEEKPLNEGRRSDRKMSESSDYYKSNRDSGYRKEGYYSNERRGNGAYSNYYGEDNRLRKSAEEVIGKRDQGSRRESESSDTRRRDWNTRDDYQYHQGYDSRRGGDWKDDRYDRNRGRNDWNRDWKRDDRIWKKEDGRGGSDRSGKEEQGRKEDGDKRKEEDRNGRGGGRPNKEDFRKDSIKEETQSWAEEAENEAKYQHQYGKNFKDTRYGGGKGYRHVPGPVTKEKFEASDKDFDMKRTAITLTRSDKKVEVPKGDNKKEAVKEEKPSVWNKNKEMEIEGNMEVKVEKEVTNKNEDLDKESDKKEADKKAVKVGPSPLRKSASYTHAPYYGGSKTYGAKKGAPRRDQYEEDRYSDDGKSYRKGGGSRGQDGGMYADKYRTYGSGGGGKFSSSASYYGKTSSYKVIVSRKSAKEEEVAKARGKSDYDGKTVEKVEGGKDRAFKGRLASTSEGVEGGSTTPADSFNEEAWETASEGNAEDKEKSRPVKPTAATVSKRPQGKPIDSRKRYDNNKSSSSFNAPRKISNVGTRTFNNNLNKNSYQSYPSDRGNQSQTCGGNKAGEDRGKDTAKEEANKKETQVKTSITDGKEEEKGRESQERGKNQPQQQVGVSGMTTTNATKKMAERGERSSQRQQQQPIGNNRYIGNRSKYTGSAGQSPPHVVKKMPEAGIAGDDHMELKDVSSSVPIFKDLAPPTPAVPPAVNAWNKPITSSFSKSASPAKEMTGIKSDKSDGKGLEASIENSVSVIGRKISKTGEKEYAYRPALPLDNSMLDGNSTPSQTIIFENTNYKAGPVASNSDMYKSSCEDAFGQGYDLENAGGLTCFSSQSVNANLCESLQNMSLSFDKGEDNSDMKLDFAFDAEFSKLTADGKAQGLDLSPHGVGLGTDAELNMKIASCKRVWAAADSFEDSSSGMNSSATPFLPANSFSTGGAFGSGSHDAYSSKSICDTHADDLSSHEAIYSHTSQMHSMYSQMHQQGANSVYHQMISSGGGYLANSTYGSSIGGQMSIMKPDGNASNASSNVCKVKPQPQGSSSPAMNAISMQQQSMASSSSPLMTNPTSMSSPSYNTFSANAGAFTSSGQQQGINMAAFGYQPPQFANLQHPVVSSPTMLFSGNQQQQQQPVGVPPPTATPPLYQAFVAGEGPPPPPPTQVLAHQTPGSRTALPFGGQFAPPPPPPQQQTFGGVAAPSGQNSSAAFNQPSAIFVPSIPPPQPGEMFQPQMSQFRMQPQPFGNNAAMTTPNTVLISSSTNSLMSATVKPPPHATQSAIGGSGMGTGMGTKGFPPPPQQSPMFISVPLDASQMNFMAANSHMMAQQRPNANMQPGPMPPSTSYYTPGSTAAGGQTNFYQPPGSANLATAPPNFGLGPFNAPGTNQMGPPVPNIPNFNSAQFRTPMMQSYMKPGTAHGVGGNDMNIGGKGGMAGMPPGMDMLNPPFGAHNMAQQMAAAAAVIQKGGTRFGPPGGKPNMPPGTQHHLPFGYPGMNPMQRNNTPVLGNRAPYPHPIQRPMHNNSRNNSNQGGNRFGNRNNNHFQSSHHQYHHGHSSYSNSSRNSDGKSGSDAGKKSTVPATSSASSAVPASTAETKDRMETVVAEKPTEKTG